MLTISFSIDSQIFFEINGDQAVRVHADNIIFYRLTPSDQIRPF